MPYCGERVLVVGDGNLSFSLALSKLRGSGCGLLATTLEQEEELTTHYDAAAANIGGKLLISPFYRVFPSSKNSHT